MAAPPASRLLPSSALTLSQTTDKGLLCLPPQDLHHGRIQMKTLTNKWYEEVRQGPSGSEDDEQELL